MKTAIVIFSCNANENNLWDSVLHSYLTQNKKFSTHILVDSESTDDTVAIAQKYGWNIVTEKKENFNHGATRQKMANNLLQQGYKIAIFATQDVILASDNTLEILEDNLKKNQAAVAYARQIPCNSKTFDGFFRLRNYPPESTVKSFNDIKKYGLMAPFCSNSLAAWDLEKVYKHGGFPATNFGEDMLLGAKFILNGEKISYCAESCCQHEHDSSWREIFMRGLAIGGLHAHNPFLIEKFGKPESCAKSSIKINEGIHYFFPLAIKYLGYIVGQCQGKIKKHGIFLPLLMAISFTCGLALCMLNLYSS